jgi:hypothetical protein
LRLAFLGWAAAATIVVYPHYFATKQLNSETVTGAGGGQEYDPRWTLFFTPHSANPGAQEYRELMAQAKQTWYWDTALIWGNPAQIRQSASWPAGIPVRRTRLNNRFKRLPPGS